MATVNRKKPHCQTCHLPMEGHRRQARTVICPSPASSSSTTSSRSSLPDSDPGITPPQSQSSTQTDASSKSSLLSSPPPTPPRMSRLHSVASVYEVDPPISTTTLIDDHGHSAHVSLAPPPSGSQQGISPLRAQRDINRNPSVQAYTPPFQVPPSGPWRRRNPNWDSFNDLPAAPPQWTAPNPNNRRNGPGTYRATGVAESVMSDETPSEVPTVLVDDDGNTVLGSLDEDPDEPRQYHVSRRKKARVRGIKQESGEDTDMEDYYDDQGDDAVSLSSSLFDRIARTSSGVIRVVRGKHPSRPSPNGAAAQVVEQTQALEIAEERARRRGVHTGRLHLQNDPPPSSAAVALKRASSWWMVLGRDKGAVDAIVRAQGKGPSKMPGTMDDLVVQNYPVMASFVQLVIAGVVGGCIVVYALSAMS